MFMRASEPTLLETFLNENRKNRNGLLSKLAATNFSSISQKYYDSLNEFLASPLLNLASEAIDDSNRNNNDASPTAEETPTLPLCATFFSGFNAASQQTSASSNPQSEPPDLQYIVAEEARRIFDHAVANKSCAITNSGLVFGIVASVRALDFGARVRREICEMCVKWMHEYSEPANATVYLLSSAELFAPSITAEAALALRGDELERRKWRAVGIVKLISQLYVHGLFPPLWINRVFRCLLTPNVLVELVEENISLASQLLRELVTYSYLDIGEFNETREQMAIFEDATFENWPAKFSKRAYFDSLVFLDFRRGVFAEDIRSGKFNLPSLTCSLAEIVVVASLVDPDSAFGLIGVDISNFIASILRDLAPPNAVLCIPLEEISLMRLRLRFDRFFVR